MLPAAFSVKLHCLCRLIPPDPSSPSDTETQEREDSRAGRTFREETRKRLCKHCDLVEADRNTLHLYMQIMAQTKRLCSDILPNLRNSLTSNHTDVQSVCSGKTTQQG